MNAAIILAGGKGERFMAPTPKQFVHLGSKPIIQHTFEAFYFHPDINIICLALPKEWVVTIEEKYRKEYPEKTLLFVSGGQSRQESTSNALKALSNKLSTNDIVLIHDGVRPFVSAQIISNNVQFVQQYGAVSTVIPAEDTIVKSVDGQKITNIPPRKNFFAAQTPQSFRFGLIRDVYSTLLAEDMESVTDDATLVLQQNKPVYLVAGEKQNFKITTPWDLFLAETLIKKGLEKEE
mgnify:CR=1 FL=1